LTGISGSERQQADFRRKPSGREGRRQNLNAILKAAGCTFNDVMDVTLFMVDAEGNFAIAQKVLLDYWGEPPYPALTGIGVTWLYGFRFEIKAIACLPSRQA
jgi:enamine deaminase RidA (YjgF/YER057c/UK114 family)